MFLINWSKIAANLGLRDRGLTGRHHVCGDQIRRGMAKDGTPAEYCCRCEKILDVDPSVAAREKELREQPIILPA
jgi:hypothetical protein